jgi:hypothetical protein
MFSFLWSLFATYRGRGSQYEKSNPEWGWDNILEMKELSREAYFPTIKN